MSTSRLPWTMIQDRRPAVSQYAQPKWSFLGGSLVELAVHRLDAFFDDLEARIADEDCDLDALLKNEEFVDEALAVGYEVMRTHSPEKLAHLRDKLLSAAKKRQPDQSKPQVKEPQTESA